MGTRKPARQRETKDRRPEGITSPVEGFNARARRAVADEQLHDSVELFTNKSVAGRNAVLNALPEAPELRERAYHIKQETMANLDGFLGQMADAVEGRGGNVFFAETGEDVVRYVGDLARRRGAKVITKSKSMATEEIELNKRLEEEYADLDLEIVETDLGEWIAQLAGDTPSHIGQLIVVAHLLEALVVCPASPMGSLVDQARGRQIVDRSVDGRGVRPIEMGIVAQLLFLAGHHSGEVDQFLEARLALDLAVPLP